jgi:hypothetical protein
LRITVPRFGNALLGSRGGLHRRRIDRTTSADKGGTGAGPGIGLTLPASRRCRITEALPYAGSFAKATPPVHPSPRIASAPP